MKSLAIICASVLQEPLVRKAREMGIKTHCFAWDKGKDSFCKDIADFYYPISIIEKDEILEVCKKIGIDGITSIANDFAVPTVCYVAQEMGLVGNSYADTAITSNKHLARQRFIRHGVSSPLFTVVHDQMDLSGFKYPLIVKPTDRCGSIGVFKVENSKDLHDAIQRARQLSFIGEVIVEEYVSGMEVSVDMISFDGTHYPLAVVDKVTTGAPYFVEIAHHEPSELSYDIQTKLIQEAKKALNAVNFKYGASDTELKVTEDGEVKVIEVNVRMGGDSSFELMKLSTGYDFLKVVIDVALNQFEKPVFTKNKYSGIYFLSKETEWVKQVIDQKDSDPCIVKSKINKTELFNLQSSADRSGYFIYQSDRKRRWGPGPELKDVSRKQVQVEVTG